MRRLGACLMIGALALGAGPAQEKKIELITVKYDGLKQEILKHRGKVVIIDFWATNCVPCIQALPHYVELQQKFGDKGLVVITVSVDPIDNKKRVERAQQILIDNKAALRNFILDEPMEVWAKKFEFTGLPFSYLFDRQGKWVRLRSLDHPNYDEIVEKTLLDFLKEK